MGKQRTAKTVNYFSKKFHYTVCRVLNTPLKGLIDLPVSLSVHNLCFSNVLFISRSVFDFLMMYASTTWILLMKQESGINEIKEILYEKE